MSHPLIDAEAWETIKSMTDPAFMVELIEVYLTDSPDLIQQMRRGISSGDVQIVRRAAHSLKTNSATFGANLLAETSRELEMIAKGGTLDGAEAKLAEIETQYAQLAPVLMELKNDC